MTSGQCFHSDYIGIMQEDSERMNCYICENCKEAKISQDCIPAWCPGGPSFSFFPYLVINSTRLWGSKCASCGSYCSSHYVMQVDQLLDLHENARAIRSISPSTIIEKAFIKGWSPVNGSAHKCCLTTDEVNMLQHLQKKKATRKENSPEG